MAACDASSPDDSLQIRGPENVSADVQPDPPAGDVLPVITVDGVMFCGTTHTVDLWAGQFEDVGSVTIYNDGSNLYVTVYSEAGYQAGEEQLKMWVGGDLANMPRNGPGNPQFGQFPYKITTDGGTTYTFTIPLDDLSLVNACGDLIYVVVHADVTTPGGGSETAFGGDTGGDTGERWWYYTTYTIQCCDTPPPFDQSETAFAKGGYVWTTAKKSNPENLPSLNLIKNRWGWAINLNGDGTTTYEIWAGAGLNLTSNGTLVGSLSVEVIGSSVTVSYTMTPGYAMQEAHIYVGDLSPTTTAPGQYGHTVYFDPLASSYSYTFDATDTNGDGIWVIAHAVVNW